LYQDGLCLATNNWKYDVKIVEEKSISPNVKCKGVFNVYFFK